MMPDPMKEAIEYELLDGKPKTAIEVFERLGFIHRSWKRGDLQQAAMEMVDAGQIILDPDLRIRVP